MRISGGKHRSGFSLVELLVVVAMMCVIAAVAVPRVMNALAVMRLHGAADSIANLTQRARMLAVQNNRPYSIRTAPINGATFVFVDTPLPFPAVDGNGVPDGGAPGVAAEPQYVLPTSVTLGGGPPVDPALLGAAFNLQPAGTRVRFNARGLPCVMVGAVCNGGVGFVLYIQHPPTLGALGVAAIAVNPTGRTTVLNYDGAAWHLPMR
jgi:prepilin-type N-terminal cleavage/methylation domain-containing protein